MLPTFVIGLREGLEAVLVVSIIATFLRRSGASLRPMWYGVASAVALSVGVGVTLQVVEQSLPQRQQEGMETVIGLVAVVFVTGMVLWMSTHARFMKRDLEGAAERALGNGTSIALVAMVFLAVLREGFETSVFLLATFQAASSEQSAFAGAVLGILGAVVLGWAMFSGGVRLNLARFFTVTSVFLVLVAAGLVLSALRTGHEAGWVTVGQGRTVDLTWLAPAGSIRAALISGVLGIPADPRVVEVLGWLCYLVPMLVFLLWPRRLRPSAAAAPLLRLGGAVLMVATAAVLASAVQLPRASVADTAPVAGGGSAHVDVDGAGAQLRVTTHGHGSSLGTSVVVELTRVRDTGAPDTGVPGTTSWSARLPATDLPSTLTLSRLMRYTGHRVPVGIDASRSPGPYHASWDLRARVDAATYGDGLVSADGRSGAVLTLTGGGLSSQRVLSVDAPLGMGSWRVAAPYTAAAEARISAVEGTRHDRTLWRHWFPAFLVVAAAWLALSGIRGRRAHRAALAVSPDSPAAAPATAGDTAPGTAPGTAGPSEGKQHVGTSS
jgi:high-affinity iron transporter